MSVHPRGTDSAQPSNDGVGKKGPPTTTAELRRPKGKMSNTGLVSFAIKPPLLTSSAFGFLHRGRGISGAESHFFYFSFLLSSSSRRLTRSSTWALPLKTGSICVSKNKPGMSLHKVYFRFIPLSFFFFSLFFFRTLRN